MVRIFKNLKMKFMNLKISTKIVVFYTALLILTVTSSSLLYQKIYLNIASKKVGNVSIQSLYSINSNITAMMENVNNYSKVILSSNEIQNSLRRINANAANGKAQNAFGYLSQYTDYDDKRNIDQYISKFSEAIPIISSIYIFDIEGNRYGMDKESLKSLKTNNISKVGWYGEALSKQGGYILRLNAGDAFKQKPKANYVSLIRVINDIYLQKPIGLLIVNISQESFENAYNDTISTKDDLKSDKTDFFLLDESGNSIVKQTEKKEINLQSLLVEQKIKNGGYAVEKIDGKNYLVSSLTISNYGWKTLSVIPFSEISKESGMFDIIAFIVILINSILLILGSILISKLITNPVRKLLKAMKGVEKGEFKKVDITSGKDEFGKLQDGYNIMIFEIEKLINKVVEEQKFKRKAELNVLQAQIRPHFLYNTFDAISSLALSGRNQDVYTVMKALGRYYRISLSKGNEVITLGEEIEIVKDYLTIQKIRYGDIFSVQYDIDPEALKLKILKLVLQPLVENALYHGIKPKGESGLITISARYGMDCVKITVEDDGVGMEEETMQGILDKRSDVNKASFGLMGTIERLRIFYGVEDIIRIESQPGSGTKIIITIPVEGGINNGGA